MIAKDETELLALRALHPCAIIVVPNEDGTRTVHRPGHPPRVMTPHLPRYVDRDGAPLDERPETR